MDARWVPGWLLVVLLTGCAGGTGQGAPIPTLPETSVPPPPPELEEAELGEPDQPTAAPTSTTDPAPTDATPTDDPAAAVGPTDRDPEALGRQIGVAGMIELLAEDPDLAGDRGRDLLAALRRIDAGRGRVDRRIRELQEEIPEWVDDGELEPAIGTATLAALAEAAERHAGDDDEDDDDDD